VANRPEAPQPKAPLRGLHRLLIAGPTATDAGAALARLVTLVGLRGGGPITVLTLTERGLPSAPGAAPDSGSPQASYDSLVTTLERLYAPGTPIPGAPPTSDSPSALADDFVDALRHLGAEVHSEPLHLTFAERGNTEDPFVTIDIGPRPSLSRRLEESAAVVIVQPPRLSLAARWLFGHQVLDLTRRITSQQIVALVGGAVWMAGEQALVGAAGLGAAGHSHLSAPGLALLPPTYTAGLLGQDEPSPAEHPHAELTHDLLLGDLLLAHRSSGLHGLALPPGTSIWLSFADERRSPHARRGTSEPRPLAAAQIEGAVLEGTLQLLQSHTVLDRIHRTQVASGAPLTL
jgi:hypothetical protein